MEADVRYTFLDALDHLPSDLIRSLWVIQSLGLRSEPDRAFVDQEALKEAQHIERMLQQQQERLEFQMQEMQEMAAIQARYMAHEGAIEVKTKTAKTKNTKYAAQQQAGRLPQIPEPLKIKINLKPSHPQETVYCTCRDVSYGAMVACDNKKCPTEWFHYGCVGLTHAPKGKWYCSERCNRQANKKRFMNL
ncbi:LADA_0A01552g1_1 [Lachancea dasiensis]|uniref:Inhibitor of growth protein 3 n=1 Tax=Lachancea dasiensis TaxID=1072105 RepID=A0A1G4IM52_9SACH|nr:LADA_0A01552g1_1 [Lachancea dasiensis]